MLANATRELMFTVQLTRAALRSNLAAQYRAASHQKQVTGRAANFGRMHFEIGALTLQQIYFFRTPDPQRGGDRRYYSPASVGTLPKRE
jgi:hypothetical protein